MDEGSETAEKKIYGTKPIKPQITVTSVKR
jgi:hypothetical protein